MENFNFFYKKGIELADLEMYDDALSCFEKAIELTSNQNDLSDVWTEKGYIMEKIKNFDMAINYQEKAIEFNPNNNDAWYMKGVAFGKICKSDEDPIHFKAVECYEKALSIKPNDTQALDNLAIELDYLKDYERALECLDKSITIDSNQYFPWFEKSRILKKIGHSEEAEKCLQTAKKKGF